MAQTDYGIKIVKPGAAITSNTISDYIYSSKWQSLPLLYKTQLALNVNSGSCTGTLTYNHNLNFFPFTIGKVYSYAAATQLIIPFTASMDGDKFNCGGDNLSEDFGMNIKLNSIEVTYDIQCIIPMFGGRCIDVSKNYTIDLYLYMFQLGS